MLSMILKTINHSVGINILKILFFTVSITLIMFYLVLRKDDPEDLFNVFLICFITGLSCYTFAKIAVNFLRDHLKILNFVLHVFLLLMGPLTGSILSCLFYYIIEYESNYHVLKTIFLYTFVFGAIFYGVFLYSFNSTRRLNESRRRNQEEKIKRLTLERETALTRLKALQAQIEPHFLFNTLSNIISLLDIDLIKAKKMLLNLNEYMRISLQITRQDMITLEQELFLISLYLDILKVRMGKRLTYEIDRRGDCSQIQFPPMIIQPLVENAIKYGLEPKKEGGRISVKCEIDQKHLTITISDTGIGMDKMSNGAGVGLDNISSRLDNIYGDCAMLTLTDNKPSGVKAIIKVTL